VGISASELLLLFRYIKSILFPHIAVTFTFLWSHAFAVITKSILCLGDDFGELGELLSKENQEFKVLLPTCTYKSNYMLRVEKFQPLSFILSSASEESRHQPAKTPLYFCPEYTPLPAYKFSSHPCCLKASDHERSACC